MANKLVKNSIIYAVGDIAPRLLGFISFPILTSYLSPDEYGIVNYVNTIILFLTTIGFLCLNTYYLVYYYKQENEQQQRRLLGNLTIFVVGINLLLSIILFAVGPALFGLMESNIDFYPYIAIGIVTNFFGIFSTLPSALFRLQERPLPLTIINIIKGVLVFGLTITLVVGFGFKAEGLLYSQMILTIIFGLIFLYITVRNMTWCINWSQIKAALIFSLPLLPGSISYLLTSMFDRILIDKYLNLADLGIYSSASSLALVLNIIAYGAYKAFEPYIFKNYGTPNFRQQFIRLYNGFFIVMTAGAFGIALFAKEFFRIFSEAQYHIAYIYVPVIAIGVLCAALAMPYGTVITARGKTKINSAISIGGGVVSLSLNIFLLPRVGLFGACITSATTYTLILLSNIYFSQIRIPHRRTILTALLMVIAIAIAVYKINIISLIGSLLLKLAIYIAFVIGGSYIMGITLTQLKAQFPNNSKDGTLSP